jgi:hypothetical protein
VKLLPGFALQQSSFVLFAPSQGEDWPAPADDYVLSRGLY